MSTKKDKIKKIQEKIDKLLEGDVNDIKILDKVDKLEREINDINEGEEEDGEGVVVEPITPRAPINHEEVYANLVRIPSGRIIYRSQDAYNIANSLHISDEGKEKLTYSSLKKKK